MTRTLFGLKKIPTNNLLEQWEFYFICTFHTIILHFKPASVVLLCPHIDISSGPNLSLTTEKWPKALHPVKDETNAGFYAPLFCLLWWLLLSKQDLQTVGRVRKTVDIRSWPYLVVNKRKVLFYTLFLVRLQLIFFNSLPLLVPCWWKKTSSVSFLIKNGHKIYTCQICTLHLSL